MAVAASANDDRLRELEALMAALGRSQAVIEFAMDGTILTANHNFLSTLGYSLDEIRGKHHRMFVMANERDTPAYEQFWASLRRGEHQSAEYRRLGKGGKEVWIQASYNPILDASGKPFKVVKIATDTTQSKLKNADFTGQIEAVSKSQAVIEFELDGTIITANKNFLDTVGYSLGEIRGKHHRMFVGPTERDSADYRRMWDRLGRGEFMAGEFKRIGRSGKDIYIQASYNPILGLDGKPYKIVKFASDVTRQVLIRLGNERVRGMMESVAAGSEELRASVDEIANSMAQSRDKANAATAMVRSAGTSTSKLSESARSMGSIVDVITKIAEQINLLALNATIESARAGDAGRGFAVVANEVKSLAVQARQATDNIATEIAGMQNIANDVLSSLGNIEQSIEVVREYVVSTSSAVEEQSAVAREMSQNMHVAAAEANKLVNAA